MVLNLLVCSCHMTHMNIRVICEPCTSQDGLKQDYLLRNIAKSISRNPAKYVVRHKLEVDTRVSS
jgi:hypothetical protein